MPFEIDSDESGSTRMAASPHCSRMPRMSEVKMGTPSAQASRTGMFVGPKNVGRMTPRDAE